MDADRADGAAFQDAQQVSALALQHVDALKLPVAVLGVGVHPHHVVTPAVLPVACHALVDEHVAVELLIGGVVVGEHQHV